MNSITYMESDSLSQAGDRNDIQEGIEEPSTVFEERKGSTGWPASASAMRWIPARI
jgi:hypothetical protein